jgi:zinc/manganese transport system substrate-binding protein
LITATISDNALETAAVTSGDRMPACAQHPSSRAAAWLLTTVTLTAGALAGCGASSPGTPGTLAVVAAENAWGDIASQIGGNHVSVTSIISDPNADPHSYESNPRDAAAVTSAPIVIENGAGYDDFIDKLLSTSPSSSRDVLNIATTVGVGGSNPNPHLWYSPQYVTEAARAIETHLAARDTGHAAEFQANLQTFLRAYQPYIDTLSAIRSKYGSSPIAYTERVPGYLVDQAGLRLATPPSFAQAIEDGNDPSPSDTAAMDSAISRRLVKVLLYNSQVTSPATQKVKDLAATAGVPVVGVAETIPASEPTMQKWQIDQARAIMAALGG